METKAEKPKFRPSHLLDGSIIPTDFFIRNYKLLLLIVLLIVLYIGNRYSTAMKLAEVDSLKKELTDVKYEALMQQTYLMRESRRSYIKELVEERGLDLVEPTSPPYRIKVKKY